MSNPAAEPLVSEIRLIALLEAKDAAQAAYSAARRAAQDARDKPLTERLRLDLEERRALTACCAADNAYDETLKAYLAGQKEAA